MRRGGRDGDGDHRVGDRHSILVVGAAVWLVAGVEVDWLARLCLTAFAGTGGCSAVDDGEEEEEEEGACHESGGRLVWATTE